MSSLDSRLLISFWSLFLAFVNMRTRVLPIIVKDEIEPEE